MKFRRTIVCIIFLLFLLSGYIIMGFTRHYLYEATIQEYIAGQKSLREEPICKFMGWETHEYLGSPEGASVVADPVFRDEIYSLCGAWLEYSTEYGIEVLPSILEEIDDEKWNLWDAYKKLTIFEYVHMSFGIASSIKTPISPSSDYDWGGSLAESIASWESAGGKREGNWMEVYKKSPEYEAWLSTIFGEIANPWGTRQEGYNPVSMEDRYRETTRAVELPLCSSLLQKDMLETDRKMTEVAYERYLVHTAEKDIIRANMDAWVVTFASSNFSSDASTDYTFQLIVRMLGFPLRDLIIDTCIIVGFSVVSTIFTMKWVLPRFTSQAKQEDQKEKPV